MAFHEIHRRILSRLALSNPQFSITRGRICFLLSQYFIYEVFSKFDMYFVVGGVEDLDIGFFLCSYEEY